MKPSAIKAYRAKRDFSKTAEPAGGGASQPGAMFVVQKHAAHRAGLHWDFRLEHDGVLWSWAVPKGPSMDPADRRMAIHVEDHPVEYADFQGAIAEGEYGAGTVETWDRGTWRPLNDPASGMRDGDLNFELSGARLTGRFKLIRLRNRDPRKPEAWFLIKGRDGAARAGTGAAALEQDETPPLDGAVRGSPPADQAPQLCRLAKEPPQDDGWLNEIKFDGYRLLAWRDGERVRLITRNGLDWTDRLPAVARAIAGLNVRSALLDGELVALRKDGASSFPDLQAALSVGKDAGLHFYLFDLLALAGWDLRACPLIERKRVLQGLSDWRGLLRFSEHHLGETSGMRRGACRMHLEGIVCKKVDAPYHGGRGAGWIKLKCLGREEFVVLGWTPPAGSRVGLGALQVGYYAPDRSLNYAGGVGTGFGDDELVALRRKLEAMRAARPERLQFAGEPPDAAIHWVRLELVVEVQYTGWSGTGRMRHAVYLGMREDKAARDVVREVADVAAKPAPVPAAAARNPGAVVVAKAPRRTEVFVAGVTLTHPDRELWPGIGKRDLANYWEQVAPHALPGLVRRPLSILRCPDGVAGEHFFQKNGHRHLPHQIREGSVSGSPYLAIDDVGGLVAMVQLSAIELHPWGAPEADPMRPDRLVFDLDPGEGVSIGDVVAAARDVRERLGRLGLESFCRTSGGKGLHVVVPLTPDADWTRAKNFCHAFAETMAHESPDKYVAHVKIADRAGRILIDWLRNGLGATAVASFCPRARPGAGVATPLAWDEVTAKLDPARFTLRTVPSRLDKQRQDPWSQFDEVDQRLPDLPARAPKSRAGARIVTARKPRARRA